jgi:Secretion system C-terminal sorting domain/Beta-propeller repeat
MIALPLQAQQTIYFEEWVANEPANLTEVQNEFLQRVASVADNYSNLYVAASAYNETTEVHDLLVTKYNSAGKEQWQEQFNISGGGDVYVGAIALDGSNNVIITGAVYNGSNNFDALTIKYSTTGTGQWYELYNGTASYYDGGVAITTDSSGNVYVAGVSTGSSTLMDFLTVKYNSSGTQQWAALYDGYGYMDAAAKIQYGSGFIRTYGTVQKNATDWAMVSVIYNASSGLSTGSYEVSPDDIVVDQINGFATGDSGSIYIAGASDDDASGIDFMVLKLSSNLELEWQVSVDGGQDLVDVAKAVAVDASGYVYVAGYVTSATRRDFVTKKYDGSDGSEIWSTTYNGAKNDDDEGTDIAIDNNGNIFVTGYSNETGNRDYHTFWLDASDGGVLWDALFNSVYNQDDAAAVLHIDEIGDLLVTGRIIALDFDSEESTEVTTVKYKRADIIIPPDEEAQSNSIAFVKNNGQLTDLDNEPVPQIEFYTFRNPVWIGFAEDTISFVRAKIDADTTTTDTLHRVDMSFAGSTGRGDGPFPLGALSECHNYYLGHIPEGREQVPLHESLLYSEVYENIDVEFSTNTGGVKYYFIVKPGGNPENLGLEFDGQTSLSVSSGDLVIETSIGDIVLPQPTAFQIDEYGQEESVSWQPTYSVDGSTVTLGLDTFDSVKPLVIKIKEQPPSGPEQGEDNLMWSTWLGGGSEFFLGDDHGFDADTDESGNLYVTGSTTSEPFPGINDMVAQSVLNGRDAFVSMFNLDAEIQWSTYYGGSGLEDVGKSIVVSQDGNIYFAGRASYYFPTGNDLGGAAYYQDFFGNPDNFGHYDGFIVGLRDDGTRVWGTYFGGYTDDEIVKIVEDGNGNLIVGGLVAGEELLIIEGVPVLTTIVAGLPKCEPPATNNGFPYCDPANSFANPTFSGGTYDAFLAKFDTERKLVWSTFFGGNVFDVVNDLAIDPSDNSVYLTGTTSSNISGNTSSTSPCDAPTNDGFPLCDLGGTSYFQGSYPGSYSKAYIAQFSSDNRLLWSTYFGDDDHENLGYAVGVNSEGNLITSGIVRLSTPPLLPNVYCDVPGNGGFPLCNPGNGAFYDDNDGVAANNDLYISRFNTGKELTWSTFFGANNGDEYAHDMEPWGVIVNLVVDADDKIFIVGHSLQSSATGLLPVKEKTGYYFQDEPMESYLLDAFVASFDSDNKDEWITYLGGGGTSYENSRDFGNAVAIDSDNRKLYAVGSTNSASFLKRCPQPNAYCQDMIAQDFDAFISRFDLDDLMTEVKDIHLEKTGAVVFPNPFQDLITVGIPESTTNKIEISVLNSIGQRVYSASFSESGNDTYSLDLSMLPPGIYFLRISYSDLAVGEKIIKVN